MKRFKILDLFCGGGGASAGYFRAGFDVVGIDISPQPEYPFRFLHRNALLCDYEFLSSFDAIHASPPCQAYSTAGNAARANGKQYPDLFHQTKAMLIASGLPYIIENVLGSPAKGVRLMGHMFGLGVIRERIFESNIPLTVPFSRSFEGSIDAGDFVTVAGNSKRAKEWNNAMGINWITDKDQLKESIPPDYTEFLGRQLIDHLKNEELPKDENRSKHEAMVFHEFRQTHKQPAFNENYGPHLFP